MNGASAFIATIRARARLIGPALAPPPITHGGTKYGRSGRGRGRISDKAARGRDYSGKITSNSC